VKVSLNTNQPRLDTIPVYLPDVACIQFWGFNSIGWKCQTWQARGRRPLV